MQARLDAEDAVDWVSAPVVNRWLTLTHLDSTELEGEEEEEEPEQEANILQDTSVTERARPTFEYLNLPKPKLGGGANSQVLAEPLLICCTTDDIPLRLEGKGKGIEKELGWVVTQLY
jgi:hypothetical protein